MNRIVLGSFFGDEGKGQWVNNLCSCEDPRDILVVRFSGANQVGHNVKHFDKHHCFSNFGSGTLQGATTYWSEYCICDPLTTIREAQDLNLLGEKPKIIYSPLCHLILPCDIWSQWENSDNREHGTVGTGFKAAVDRIKAGYSIQLVHATNPLILREKLRGVMKYYYKVESSSLPAFNYDKWVETVCEFVSTIRLASFHECSHSFKEIIFEGSQGILLDQIHGIMPFCTPSNTTSKNATFLLGRYYLSNTETYYVCRPYITRHGNGPLCTSSEVIDVEDPNNSFNDFQKTLRGCKFDLDLLRYSLRIDSLYNHFGKKYVVFSHCDELEDSVLNQVKSLEGIDGVYGFEYEEWKLL